MPRKIVTNYGKSLSFDGATNGVTVTGFKLSTTAFSVAFWAKVRKFTANDRVFDQQDAGPANGATIIESANGLSFVIRNVGTNVCNINSTHMNTETWYHVTATYEVNSAKFYINGVQVGATDTSVTMTDSTAVLLIGKRVGGSNYFNGYLNDFLVYNRVLTTTEIADLMYRRIIPTSPQVYYEFNDSLSDSSGNGNTGSAVGSLTYSTQAPAAVRNSASSRDSLPQNYVSNAGTLLESFQTIGDWTRGGASGSIAEDTAHFTEGDKSIAVTFVSGTSVFYDKTINTVVGGNLPAMLLKIYIPSLTNLGSVALYIASVSNFSKFFSKTIQATALHEGYNYIPIAPSEWSNTGSESWANTMVRLRIRVNATTGTPSASFCSIHTAQYNRPKVLVTFDDSWDSQYLKGYAYMSPIGLKGTIYAIGSKLGTAGYCTLANLQEMYADGWDIGNHGSVNLTTLATQALQEAEIASEEAYISNFTRSNKHYAYPNGGYDDNAKAALASLSYLTARTIIDRQQANYIDERYLITRYGVYNTTTVAATKGYIDRAIEQGSTVWLNYHLIVDATADVSTKVLTADFNEVMDYIYSKKLAGALDVVTVSEWYNGLTNPRRTTTSRTSV